MATEAAIRITPEEYLRLERLAEAKSEYYDGEVVPMPGVSRAHNRINGNILYEIQQQIFDRPCEVYFCEMRVKVPAGRSYVYPDVAVLCGEPNFEDAHVDTLLNPQVLIEILSESTETNDRGRKLRLYRRIEGLQEYLLVSQTECRIERYFRQPSGDWTYSDITDSQGVIELASVVCRLALAQVYRRIEFSK